MNAPGATITVISNHLFADVWYNTDTGQYAICSTCYFSEDDIITEFTAATIHKEATYLTLQTGAGKHISLAPSFLQYVNHSCDPNVFFDTVNMKLICIKPIKPGDELCFFYPSSEWQMARPFHCKCGSENCLQIIEGAHHLPEDILSKYRLTDFVLQQLRKNKIDNGSLLINASELFVWVLAPTIQAADTNIDYYYDYSQSIAEYTNTFEELGAQWKWMPLTIKDYEEKIKIIIKEKHNSGKIHLALNLCDGDEINGTPGISVIKLLEGEDFIYTGADEHFYEITTSKIPMKKAFDAASVSTPVWEIISHKNQSLDHIFEKLGKPVIIKPSVSGGSMGVGTKSVVYKDDDLKDLIEKLYTGYRGWDLTADGLIAESFINGNEYTTLIVGSHSNSSDIIVYTPAERVFHPSLPEHERFLSFDRLWEIYEDESPMPDQESFYEYRLPDLSLIDEIKKISRDAFVATKGTGYARVDIRRDKNTGKLFVLEINAQCGISEDENYTSIGAILRLSGKTFSELVTEIINETLSRQHEQL